MAVPDPTSRYTALDGLRGWAALAVVIYHCWWVTFERAFPELMSFPAALAGNGILAIAVFFMISGYVLTLRRWRNPHNEPLPVTFVRRYVRLTLPILAATLLVWALMALGQTPTRAANRIVEVPSWYGTFLRFDESLPGALWFAFAGTYAIANTSNYNPFLWTMMIELWGALAAFMVSQYGRFRSLPYVLLIVLGAICFVRLPVVACFFAGALVALAERDGFAFRRGPATSLIATIGLIAALVAGAIVQMIDRDVLWLSLLGTAVFMCAHYSSPVQRFLNLPLSQFMGRISFPLYLVQFAVIVSFSAQLIVAADAGGWLNAMSAAGIAAASVALSLTLAVVFLPVETGTLALLRRFGRRRRARPEVSATA